MKRAALYARYSTDRQNDRSIEDQFAVCKACAAAHQLDVVALFDDRGISGESIHGRRGMQELLACARAGAFDAVIAETLSRIGRDEEDRAYIRKRLTFVGVKIITPAHGVVTRLVDNVSAIVDSQQLEDLKQMIRRGQAGVVRNGRHAGGRAFGYRPIPGRPGELAIDDAEAQIVRRIFERFVAGENCRAIAAALNAEGVPAPRRLLWRASAIHGNALRGTGILANELYAGVIVWNRVHMIKDPDTGRRVSRPNKPAEWQRAPAPHLAIVDPAVWTAAQSRREGHRRVRSHTLRRPKHLLSGLLRCGRCGAGMAIKDGRPGARRIICSGRKEAGAAICDNAHTYDLAAIERLVLAGLRDKLTSPAALARYVEAYNEERRRLAGRAAADRARLESQLAAATRELDRAIQELIKGRLTDAEADRILPELRARRADLERGLAAAEPPPVIALHPAAIARYRADVEALQAAIGADDAGELAASIRSLVHSVTVQAKERGKPLTIDVAGRLAALTGTQAYPHGLLRVAEVRYPQFPTDGALFPFRVQAAA